MKKGKKQYAKDVKVECQVAVKGVEVKAEWWKKPYQVAQNELQPSSIQPQLLPHVPPDPAGLQGQLAALGALLHPLAAAWQTPGTAGRLSDWMCV